MITKNMTTFKELGLNKEIIKSLDDLGFIEPTPIQEKSIPFLLNSDKDLIALAQTGTGKTAAFSLPIINQIEENEADLKVLILCPTRELCLQIFGDIQKFIKYSKTIEALAVYGGEKIDYQIRALKKRINIVVGTPGRVHDLIRRGNLNLQHVKWVVLDEADEMLDMGFKEDLDAILEKTPKIRQTLLFSATMSKGVRSLAEKYMKNIHEISIGQKNVGAENVSHEYYVVQARERFESLKRVLDSLPGIYGILFCRTRKETQDVADKLKRYGYNAEAIHGEISQKMRTKIMNDFKKKSISLLVATDVAARGIDVSELTHVINYNLPDQNETYTHRSGRTGRAQKSGISISFITKRDLKKIKQIERIIAKKIEEKQVPTIEDMHKKKLVSLVEDIQKAGKQEIDNKKFFEEANKELQKINKEDLVNYLVFSKFRDFLKNKKEEAQEGKQINLKINFGRRQRFDVKKLFDLINTVPSLKGMEIGRIDLMSEFSIFSVSEEDVDKIIKGLRGKKFRGQMVKIMRDKGKTTNKQYKRFKRRKR